MYGIYRGGSVLAAFAAPTIVRSNVPTFGNDTLNLKRNVVRRPAQRWEISSNLMPQEYDSNELFALFVESGHDTGLDVLMPQTMGSVLKRNVQSATASGIGSSISVTTAGTIPRGTFIKFSGRDKVYMAKSTRVGSGMMDVYPNVLTTLAGATMSYGDDVVMKAMLDFDSLVGMAYVDGILMDNGVVKLIEDLR